MFGTFTIDGLLATEALPNRVTGAPHAHCVDHHRCPILIKTLGAEVVPDAPRADR